MSYRSYDYKVVALDFIRNQSRTVPIKLEGLESYGGEGVNDILETVIKERPDSIAISSQSQVTCRELLIGKIQYKSYLMTILESVGYRVYLSVRCSGMNYRKTIEFMKEKPKNLTTLSTLLSTAFQIPSNISFFVDEDEIGLLVRYSKNLSPITISAILLAMKYAFKFDFATWRRRESGVMLAAQIMLDAVKDADSYDDIQVRYSLPLFVAGYATKFLHRDFQVGPSTGPLDSIKVGHTLRFPATINFLNSISLEDKQFYIENIIPPHFNCS